MKTIFDSWITKKIFSHFGHKSFELFSELCKLQNRRLEYLSAFPYEGPYKINCMSDYSSLYDKIGMTTLFCVYMAFFSQDKIHQDYLGNLLLIIQ